MNKKLLLVAFFLLFTIVNIFGRQQTPQMQIFQSNNGTSGKYWPGNNKFAGKAYVGQNEYTKVIAIKKKNLTKKSVKKLHKGKLFLGLFIDQTSDTEYYLYGEKKHPELIDDTPDSDVITMIAIKEDYGIGE
jgi:hypothetical protein